MSAIERCPLFLSAIKRFFYGTLTMISSVLRKSVRFRQDMFKRLWPVNWYFTEFTIGEENLLNHHRGVGFLIVYLDSRIPCLLWSNLLSGSMINTKLQSLIKSNEYGWASHITNNKLDHKFSKASVTQPLLSYLCKASVFLESLFKTIAMMGISLILDTLFTVFPAIEVIGFYWIFVIIEAASNG